MQDFEKPGLFYLGKIMDPSNGELTDDLLLYESKNLTTHAMCVGMTGSGKTGLGIAVLEEAGLQKIPAIVIDPKGDLCDLLLTFPHLSPEEFKPWVDAAEGERKGMSLDAYSSFVANMWKEGLSDWGEDEERVKKFKNTVDATIYTPASNAGVPVSILRSFDAPSKEELLDPSGMREKILSMTSSLLGLIGIDADPIKSKEHILISTLIQSAWQKGVNLDISTLIHQIQKPPFSKIGALDIDTFYPPKERMNLSISLNNLLASPGFHAWMEGVPLDIDKLLYTSAGKPRIAVFSIAHLSDSERMFFVTLLLNACVGWMRKQSGTSNLRALLYMDEIFGFFPPIATPPSKLPMLTLLKQARAYGLGIFLTTQNPVDLDYKGLSNCGTWFIGKLQTERDKARVLEGLNTASNGEFDVKELDQMIALTGNRKFIMRSIYVKNPVLFNTRWTLSYLRGPLTLSQIAKLTQKSEEFISPVVKKELGAKPHVPHGVDEFFNNVSDQRKAHYEPKLLGMAKVHFVDAKKKIDLWKEVLFALPYNENEKRVNWEEGIHIPTLKDQLKKEPAANSTFEELPAGLMQQKNYDLFAKQLAASLYQSYTITVYESSLLGSVSNDTESEQEFRLRAAQDLLGKREETEKKIRGKYAVKIAGFREKIKKAEARLTQRQHRSWLQKIQTGISFAATILGTLLGGKVTKGTLSQTGTSLRRATQMGKDAGDVNLAEEEVKIYQQQLRDLESQMQMEISGLGRENLNAIQINKITLRPRKSDLAIEKIALIWWSN